MLGPWIASVGWAEVHEQLDLFPELDRRELSAENQPLEPLELGQPLLLPGSVLDSLPVRLHLFGHVAGGGEDAEHVPASR